MRFVLDHDVDAAVCRMLIALGHECWTVGDAHLATANDDDIAVYASNKGACLITHDKEAARRRTHNLFGQTIRLACAHPDAVDLLRGWMERVEERLQEINPVVLRVAPDSVKVLAPSWYRET